MEVLEPIFYFDESSNPVWTVSPALPNGLVLIDGNISGIPTDAQPLSMYNVTVTGDLVPYTFVIMIEILGEYIDPVIEDNRNQTELEQGPPETIFPDLEEDSIAYWICPLILIIILWLTAMIYNARKKDKAVELAEAPEVEEKSD